ncbi:hypothetical protein CHS0354_023968 [Potamilus streckersoni]|uniref:Uncharacterized protein n=1 Tax=Potamilus streckersoni TaxID=2493646 RepID=A0AAE0VMM1_9BIVA|nr:hypothetical protein CHS0354_023968 [Potamilus streckersoni]
MLNGNDNNNKKKLFLEQSDDAWQFAFELVASSKRIVLSTHENSDCDGLGSESALFQVLKKLGKEVVILNPTKVYEDFYVIPYMNLAMAFDDSIEKSLEILQNTDLFILLDTNHLSRTKNMKPHLIDYFRSKSMSALCIDHHLDPEDFADVMVCDSRMASTGELVFSFIKYLEKRYLVQLLDKDIADGENRIAYIVITQDMLKATSASIFETERLFEYLIGIRTVLVALLFVQINDIEFKLSLRSKGDIPVNFIAKDYGGGGHKNAAGCKTSLPFQTFLSEVLASVTSLIN